MTKNKITIIIISFILVGVIFLSVGYAALNTTLEISGIAELNFNSEVILEKVTNQVLSNGAIEAFTPTLGETSITVGGTLPNLDSSVVYYVSVKNLVAATKKLEKINEILNNNDLVEYTISGLGDNTYLNGNSSSTIEILIKYKESVTELPENTNFGFMLDFVFTNVISEGGSDHENQDYIADDILLDLRGYTPVTNGNWVDQYGKTLKLYGDTTRNTETNSYIFDGSGDYAEASQPFIPKNSDFTLEAYFEINTDASGDYALISQVSNTTNSSGRFKLNLRKNISNAYLDGGITIFWNNNYTNGNVYYDAQKYYEINIKYLFQMKRVNADHKVYLYMNGVLVNSYTVDSDQVAGIIDQNNLKIGKFNNSSTQYFNGNVYAVRIYNRALSDEELQNNYIVDKTNYNKNSGNTDENASFNLYDKLIANDLKSSGTEDGLYLSNDGMYFRGINPKNYLKIDDRLFRIISIDNENDNMKIIQISDKFQMAYDEVIDGSARNSSVSTFCTNYVDKGCNAWTTYDALTAGSYSGSVQAESSLNTYLNGTYYNNLPINFKSMIKDTTQYVGAVSPSSSFDSVIQQAKTKPWTGKVAIMDIRDVFYASSTNPSIGSSEAAISNYLTKISSTAEYFWTCSQTGTNNWDVWTVVNSNRLVLRRSSRIDQDAAKFYIMPVYTINKQIQVTGLGISSNPYIYTE